jgi:hypothetical protein
MRDVFVGDRLVAKEMAEHGSAGVDENAEVDWKILVDLEGEDLAGSFVVIEEAQIGEFEVVDGDAVEVGGVEGEADFVNGHIECVGLGVGR